MEKPVNASLTQDPKGDEAIRDRESMGNLRQTAQQQISLLEHARPTVARVTTIVNDLLARRSLDETAAKMGLPTKQQNVDLVLGVIARYGTWLTHTVEVNEVEPVYASDFKGKNYPTGSIVIPEGYEPDSNGGRDIARALASIIANKPDAEVSARFVDRTYRMRSSQLTYQTVSSVWGFATRGRLPRIRKVSDDPIFHLAIVSAFDLLDVARQDAFNALQNIIAVEKLDTDTIAQIRDWLMICKWVHEGESSRLLRVTETALLRPASIPALERELAQLKNRVEETGTPWDLRTIGSLNAGQVRRISANGGLVVDAPAKTNEAAIRTTLRSMGLSQDADKLVPEAMRASDRNLLDEFWNVLQQRVEGDVTWSEQLEELLA